MSMVRKYSFIAFSVVLIVASSVAFAASLGNADSMTGTVAVGVFFVESNGTIDPNTYSWNSTEEQTTIAAINAAFNYWSNQALLYGTSVTFSPTIYHSTDPATQQGYEPVLRSSSDEGLWIGAIMNNLGYTSGTWADKVNAYNTWLKGHAGTNWAFSIFIVYNPPSHTLNWGAHATAGLYTDTLSSEYDGTQNGGSVLAHEIGHIFWACDEQWNRCSSGACVACRTDGPRPTVLNGNCGGCNPNSVTCIMHDLASFDLPVCCCTAKQIGWTCPTPSSPTLTNPANGATGVIQTPLLIWNAVSGANSYNVQVCSNSTCSSVVTSADVKNTQWQILSPLNIGTKYWWRVRTNTPCNSTSSSIGSFTVCSTGGTTAPNLLGPINGAVDVSFSPTLDWSDVSGAKSYTVQVCTDGACSSIVRSATVTSSQWLVSPSLNSGIYWWRVRSNNSCGSSLWTGSWGFITNMTTSSPVVVQTSGNTGLAYGSLSAARKSTDQNQAIGCALTADSPLTYNTSCTATTSTGKNLTCTSTNSNIYQVARDISAQSTVTFSCDNNIITNLKVDNFSYLLP